MEATENRSEQQVRAAEPYVDTRGSNGSEKVWDVPELAAEVIGEGLAGTKQSWHTKTSTAGAGGCFYRCSNPVKEYKANNKHGLIKEQK